MDSGAEMALFLISAILFLLSSAERSSSSATFCPRALSFSTSSPVAALTASFNSTIFCALTSTSSTPDTEKSDAAAFMVFMSGMETPGKTSYFFSSLLILINPSF